MRPFLLALAAVILLTTSAGGQATRWYRGNTHTHTLNSDGDSPPDVVAKWYRDHGYHFLFITDHEKITDPHWLNERLAVPGMFLLIGGQEVTQRVADSTHHQQLRQAHLNSLGATTVVMPMGERGIARGTTMRDAYMRNVELIRSAGGIPQINHPNFIWSVRPSDLSGLRDTVLLEIANAHTGVNNAGDGREFMSTEQFWDSLLSSTNLTVFGVADDDAHSFKPENADAYDLTRPGRAWIMVRADTLSERAIYSAIRRGDFYSSTGVTIDSLTMGPSLRLVMKSVAQSRFKTDFIGSGGRILDTQFGLVAEYRPRRTEGYVRARVTDSNGRMAWTQPLRVAPRP